MTSSQTETVNIPLAVRQLRKAAAARMCWCCGCLHNALTAIIGTIPERQRSAALIQAVGAARARLTPVHIDCRGCTPCYPAIALHALQVESHCATKDLAARQGWPPLPGDYTVLRYHGAVAVWTLTDGELARDMVATAEPSMAIVGTLQTENLGIERLIRNLLANPSLRFLVVCGPDSRQPIGHLPGQSLLALARHGVDARSHIIGAPGKRPVLRNLDAKAVEHFRRTVDVIDLLGVSELATIQTTIQRYARRYDGPATPFGPTPAVTPIAGYLAPRMIPDPAGYFVVYVDRLRRCLALEHYQTDGLLDTVVKGTTAAELYIPAIERRLLSRLEHAAYLGRESAHTQPPSFP